MLEGLFLAGAAQQMARANRAQTTGEMASTLATEVRTQNESIAADVERLFLIAHALWTFLKEEHGYTNEDLNRRIQDIDMADGKLDGKIAKSANPDCPQCGRKLMGKQPVCLYCGTTGVRDALER